MWFCCYCCCVCWFFKSSFGYIFQFCFLQGLDQLRPGILQQQKSFMQSPQSFTQLQLLTPQQQLLIQAQQSTTSPAMGDVDSRRLRMLLSSRNMILGKDALSNAVGDVVQNVGSPMQAVCPVLPRSETDMLFKVLFCAIVFSFLCTMNLHRHIIWVVGYSQNRLHMFEYDLTLITLCGQPFAIILLFYIYLFIGNFGTPWCVCVAHIFMENENGFWGEIIFLCIVWTFSTAWAESLLLASLYK